MSKEKTSGIYFKTSDKDLELIAQRMEQANVRNRSAYIRKMCIDGYVLRLELPELTTCAVREPGAVWKHHGTAFKNHVTTRKLRFKSGKSTWRRFLPPRDKFEGRRATWQQPD